MGSVIRPGGQGWTTGRSHGTLKACDVGLWLANARPRSLKAAGATLPPSIPTINELQMIFAPAARMMLRFYLPGE
jgi:hypothetical protein